MKISKEERKNIAKLHSQKMIDLYKEEIVYSIKNTITYNNKSIFKKVNGVPNIKIDDIDSVEAVLKYNSNKTAVLNFASYLNPGGGFINGAMAQEEALCHNSFLYEVLKEKKDFYDFNFKHKNNSLYLDRALYSKDIYFKNIKCDVITCAAPNKTAYLKYNKDINYVNKVLKDRIDFILKIANENKVDTLIAGAFGCGVFGQDPYKVASVFKELISDNRYGNIKHIIFAIPKKINLTNYLAFESVFR